MTKWIAILNDNSKIKEDEKQWNEIQEEVKYLYFDYNGQKVLPPENCHPYQQATTASAPLGGGEITVESRYITCTIGNNTMRIRVDENSNQISIEVD
jgi:hypothetical protein